MTFVTLDQAKDHLRVTESDEDDDITLKLEAAEGHAIKHLNRHVYANQTALDAAKAAAPGILSTASAAYETAVTAAKSIENCIERNMALLAAEESYAAVQVDVLRTYRGIVINDEIKAAVLLTVGHLYANREDVVTGVTVTELPTGAKSLLREHRISPGL